MIPALLIAKAMNIPTYFVFDADADKPDKNGSRVKHIRDNTALLKLAGVENPEPMPAATVWGPKFVMWSSDIADVVAKEVGKDLWSECVEKADADFGHPGNLQKNALSIAATLNYAWNRGKRSRSLDRLCVEIIGFTRAGGPPLNPIINDGRVAHV